MGSGPVDLSGVFACVIHANLIEFTGLHVCTADVNMNKITEE